MIGGTDDTGGSASKEWKGDLRDLAAGIASRLRQAGNRIERVIDRDPYHIVGYRGYATAGRALVQGRVLEDEGLRPADLVHSDWRNLLDALRRLESDPLPFARVRAHFGGHTSDLVADDEGFLREWIPLAQPLTAGWQPIQLELLGAEHATAPSATAPSATAPSATAPSATAPVLHPATGASFGVVSDLDDTVLQSEVRHFLRAARIVLLENARTRLPFPGVAEFYRALRGTQADGGGNPIFYVSSSPWNLYDVISNFLDQQRIPAGPLLLRDWDFGRSMFGHRQYKSERIAEVLEAYPALPFILIGDSAQEDPEIYADVVQRYPGRVLAVYVRNVTAHPGRSAALRELAKRVVDAGSSMVLADDTLAAARHAAEHGWIATAALPAIGADKREDEDGPAKVDAPGVDPREQGPTLVVEE
ncbi:MAG TPA: phosphatase domain-containing protein [Gemmatimonadales bacterium]|nr:phosphatase domain-containing protein [Gemmatimonadales bacterium]